MISKNINTIRKRWKMSQQSLGELLGVSRNVVVNWERGHSAPGLAPLAFLAGLCGLPAEAILHDELDPNTLPIAPLPDLPAQMAQVFDRLDRIERLLTQIANQLSENRSVND